MIVVDEVIRRRDATHDWSPSHDFFLHCLLAPFQLAICCQLHNSSSRENCQIINDYALAESGVQRQTPCTTRSWLFPAWLLHGCAIPSLPYAVTVLDCNSRQEDYKVKRPSLRTNQSADVEVKVMAKPCCSALPYGQSNW